MCFVYFVVNIKKLMRVDYVWRRLDHELHRLARDRMRERQPQRMQQLAARRHHETTVRRCVAVERIPHHGMPDVRGMYADLVRPPGLDRELDK